MTPTLFTERPQTRAGIVPRPYQEETHDAFFKLYEEGVRSALIRLFTGGGKTLLACLIADTWLRRGDNYRVMVVSYEKQLAWQFAQEVEDYLGIKPGIEMEAEAVAASRVPKIVVASRATLLRKPPATAEQAQALAEFGVPAIGSCTKKLADTYLRHLRKGGDLGSVLDDMQTRNAKADVDGESVSRLHKFDWRFNWLVIWDEAHKHAKKLPSVGHIADWFERNPASCRLGLTATPKRTDQTAIQHTMFQGTACDYPLYHVAKPCAVKDGYAVPYVQKYIEVEGVDFRQIKRLTSGGDFDEAALEAALGEEAVLAKLVGPLLELAGERRTLIFSPGVEMAKNVARYINARRRAKCDCGLVAWYPAALIGDGVACECGRFITTADIFSHDDQARQLDGKSPTHERKGIYKGHQQGHFQFLSICGLCVAKGTMVLTDLGEVPIERVTRGMKLWDGVDFVSHGGVIPKGEQAVIRYAGLTATGDHNVWTGNGWERFAACKQQGTAIRVSAIGGQAVRESCGYYRGDNSTWQESEGRLGGAVRWLRKNVRQVLQRIEGRPGWLQALREVVRRPELAADALPFGQEALREFARRVLPGLRGAWNRVPLCFAGGDGSLGHGKLGFAQGIDAGPREQRRPLRAGQHPLGQSDGASQQQEATTPRLQETVEVYDILNAGPRHRFTANGLIVSNCREGYNDPDVSCIAVFRPVSKKASSLAEQMKGRGCRLLRALAKTLHTLPDAEARVQAIAESAKPDCLAAGTPILTDCGLVPIEQVTTDMKVWDGLSFVTHSGVIYRGRRRVITYAGLTATPDHRVFIHDETNQSAPQEAWTRFGDAAAKQTPIRVTGIGRQEVRETNGRYRRDSSEGAAKPSGAFGGVRLRQAVGEGLYGGHSASSRLPSMRLPGSISGLALSALPGGEGPMRQPEEPGLLPLRRSWHPIRLRFAGGNVALDSGESWSGQGAANRPDRQQRQLFAGESSVRDQLAELRQHEALEMGARNEGVSNRSSRSQILSLPPGEIDRLGIDVEGDSGEVFAPVYDILNAGPRHRFTAAGLLVHNCLVVDLVGITGLADCASTVEIYADGLPDEVKKRAEEILSGNADGDEPADVEAAVEQAGREAEETAAKVKAEREAAERRAKEEYEKRSKADAKANYTTHEVGYGSNVDPNVITEGQLNFIGLLGMHLEPGSVTKRQAGRIIGQLKARIPAAEVARLNSINEERWRVEGISLKIRGLMRWKGVSIGKAKTGYDCFQILDAAKEPGKFEAKKLSEIRSARDKEELDAVAQDLCLVRGVLLDDAWKRLADAGREKRRSCQ